MGSDGWVSRVLFLAMLAAPAAAQRPSIEAFGVGDGLPAAEVYDLEPDPSGRLWILSRAGIAVYDGQSFTTLTGPDVEPGSSAGALAVDARGRLWASLYAGAELWVARREGDAWTRLPQAPSLPRLPDGTTSLTVIAGDGRDFVAVATAGGGLAVWDGRAWTRLGAAEGLPSAFVHAALAHDEAVWVGAESGLCRILAFAHRCHGVADDPRLAEPILALDLETPAGDAPRLWILGSTWLGYLEGRGDEEGRLTVVAGDLGRRLEQRTDVIGDGLGGAWFGDAAETSFLDRAEGSMRTIGRRDGLAGDGVTALARDRESHLWIGGTRGLSRIRSQRFLSYDQDQGLLDDEVTAIAEPTPGRLVFGHNHGWTLLDETLLDETLLDETLLDETLLDADGPRPLPFPKPANGPPITSRVLDLAADGGDVWTAAHEYGLLRLRPDGSWSRVELPAPADPVVALELDAQGTLWVLGLHHLFRRRGTRFSAVDFGMEIEESATFRWLSAAPDGRLFLTTVGGLLWRDGGTWSRARGPHPHADNVYSVLAATSGEVWVGTRAGLYELRGGALEKVERGPLSLDRPIYFLFEDPRRRLWLGTEDGVFVWDGQRLRQLTVRHGLAGRETNRGAGFVDHRGQVWIGTDRGVSVYRERYDVEPAVAPGLEFRALEVDGTPWPLAGEVRLRHHQNALTFHVDAIFFSREEDVQYRYRLEGVDDGWRGPETLAAPVFRYSSLPPGRYRFRISAGWPNGPWSGEVTSPEIVISPPFWLQAWFLVAAASVTGLGAYGVHLLRIQAIRSKNVELLEVNTRLNASGTERQHLIAELEARNAELERFTYTVSHDLKSPLVTVRGFLGLLARDAAAGDAERLRDDIAQIEAASAKMARLLDELLELSRIGRVVHAPAEVDLSELARQAAVLVHGQISARGVAVDIAPDLPVVHGDPTRLLEVFQNLIDNAAKYMGDQSAPRIEIGARTADGETGGGEPVVFVADNGAGIEPRYHEKVFGLFERLDQEVDGSGVGLALVKRIVEFHGGRIWVESEGRGRGSTFCFTLPAA